MSDPAPASPWNREVQQIRLATFGRGMRLVGFTAPKPKSGVTSLCAALAAATAASGLRTLLVDLSQPADERHEKPTWLPGCGHATAAAIPCPPWQFDVLTAHTTSETRDLFNNSAQLRWTLMDELSDYAAIIVDIAPLTPVNHGGIDATSAAAACGNVYLVCASGDVTKDEVSESMTRLHSAGVEVLALILNDVDNPSLGVELAREVLRLKKFAPEWTERIAKKLLANSFLN